MIGGNGTPDKHNAQKASSLYMREPSKKNAGVRTGRKGDLCLEKKL